MMTSTMSKPDGPTRVGAERDHPLLALPREDLDLVCELVLQSGSLKGLASSYGVSYPTIRARLDKTIGRLRAVVEGATPDPVADLLASLVERGELSVSGARALRDTLRDTIAANTGAADTRQTDHTQGEPS